MMLRSPLLAMFISLAAWCVLGWFSHGAEPVPLAVLWSVLAVAWITLAWSMRGPVSLKWLWIGAVAFRLVGLWSLPVLEDDWARYLWDGWRLLETGDPYMVAPAAFFSDSTVPETMQTLLNQINHPDVPTIYGPVTEACFGLGAWVKLGALWPLKLLLMAVELGVLGLLVRWAGARRALLFAWCPLLIQETSFTAHPDCLWVAWLVLATWARERGWVKFTAAACGLAVATKVFAIVLVPFLLRGLRWWWWMLAAGVTALCYAPFWRHGNTADLAGLRAMSGDWEFNSPVVFAVSQMINVPAARMLGMGLTCGLLLWFWGRKRCDGAAIYGAFFLGSAVVNPWYLAVLVPFLVRKPHGALIGALVAGSLSYAHGLWIGGGALAPYELAAWVRPAEWTLVLAGAWLGTKWPGPAMTGAEPG